MSNVWHVAKKNDNQWAWLQQDLYEMNSDTSMDDGSFETIPASGVNKSENAVLTRYNFTRRLSDGHVQYLDNLQTKSPWNFMTHNLEWNLVFDEKMKEDWDNLSLTLVSRGDDNNGHCPSIQVQYYFFTYREKYHFQFTTEPKSINFSVQDLKNLPVTKSIKCDHKYSIVFIEISVLRDIEKPNKVLDDLRLLLSEEKFSDVTLVVGRIKFKAHRVILAARSPVFSAIFNEPQPKTTNKNGSNMVITMKGFKAKIVEEMLQYIYTGKLRDPSNVDVSQLLHIASEYQISDLKVFCEDTMIGNLNVSNVASCLELSDKYNSPRLRQKGINFLKERQPQLILAKLTTA